MLLPYFLFDECIFHVLFCERAIASLIHSLRRGAEGTHPVLLASTKPHHEWVTSWTELIPINSSFPLFSIVIALHIFFPALRHSPPPPLYLLPRHSHFWLLCNKVKQTCWNCEISLGFWEAVCLYICLSLKRREEESVLHDMCHDLSSLTLGRRWGEVLMYFMVLIVAICTRS